VFVLPIRRGSRNGLIPLATLTLALASAIVFFGVAPRDRAALNAAADFYTSSGLAAVELPRYREYLAQGADPDSLRRLAELEHAAGPSERQLADPVAAIEALRSDRAFDRALHVDQVVTPSDPGYAEWKRNRAQFDQLERSVLGQRMELSSRSGREPWRLVTYLFLHPTAPQLLTSLLVLLLVGSFAEAAAGPALLLLCYLGGGAFSGLANLLWSSRLAVGDWGALAALAGLLAGAFGTRRMVGRLIRTRRTIAVPGISALLVVIGVEALRWFLVGHTAIDLQADLAGIAFGAGMAFVFKLGDSRRVRDLVASQAAEDDAHKESSLSRQAREAAARLETRRATQLFKELVDLEPRHIEHLSGYLNVALLGPDETVLQDAALRLLWLRSKSHSDQIRKAFLQLTQPKVLKVLPIDEHLRLARRLVKLREDAAALRVLDAILSDGHLRQLYGRQLADCLLGIYTGYVRRRLTTLAEMIHSRLTTYFEPADELGGLPPSSRPTTTVLTSSLRPPNTRFPRG